MPQLKVTTKSANQVWASPDGQRKIYELNLEYEGKPVLAKTYSEAIATEGWEGTVDTYEKQGRTGIETFVKQPPKEDGQYGGKPGGRSYQPKDEKAIQAMWAISQAIAYCTALAEGLTGPKTEALFNESLENVATKLFGMVDTVKTSDAAEEGEAPADEPANPDPVIEDIPDRPVDLSKIEEIFGPKEKKE